MIFELLAPGHFDEMLRIAGELLALFLVIALKNIKRRIIVISIIFVILL